MLSGSAGLVAWALNDCFQFSHGGRLSYSNLFGQENGEVSYIDEMWQVLGNIPALLIS